MLAASVAAQAGASVAINGPAFLIPSLQEDRGLSLAPGRHPRRDADRRGDGHPVPVGAAVDRVGERTVLLAGLGGTVILGAAATQVQDTVLLGATLFVVGMFAACTGSASGRIVVGWFPPRAARPGDGDPPDGAAARCRHRRRDIAVVAERVDVSAALWVPVVATALAFVLCCSSCSTLRVPRRRRR